MILQKIAYNLLLSGFPTLTYNPITKRPFQGCFEIQPKSFYINFLLEDYETLKYINTSIPDNFEPVPIILDEKGSRNYLISVNVYNVSSPLLNTDELATRCEVNTYVRRKDDGVIGTVILDYTSNKLSMDPVNIFKAPTDTIYWSELSKSSHVETKGNDFSINVKFNMNTNSEIKIHGDLHKFTDNIFYTNGVYDKIYYDSSLTHAQTFVIPSHQFESIQFTYLNISYKQCHSSFFFKDKIQFTGAMWYNLYDNT